MCLVPAFLAVLRQKPIFNNLDLFEIQVRVENRGSVASYVIGFWKSLGFSVQLSSLYF